MSSKNKEYFNLYAIKWLELHKTGINDSSYCCYERMLQKKRAMTLIGLNSFFLQYILYGYIKLRFPFSPRKI